MIVSDATAERIRHLGRSLLPWLLVVAVIGNVAITAKFQSGTSHSVRVSESSDLADLVDSTYPETRQEYAIYAELGRFAHGATLVLPSSHPFDSDRLRFLAGVTLESGDWFPDDLVDSLSPTVSGPMVTGDHLIRYSLVEGKADEPYGAIRAQGLVLIAPIRLLEAADSGR